MKQPLIKLRHDSELLEEAVHHYKVDIVQNNREPSASSCNLCKMFGNQQEPEDDCGGCPIATETGRTGCGGTPYYEALHEWEGGETGQGAYTHRIRMYDWLRSLKKKIDGKIVEQEEGERVGAAFQNPELPRAVFMDRTSNISIARNYYPVIAEQVQDVLPVFKSWREDLTVHDRALLENMEHEFVHFTGSYGTFMLVLTVSDWPKEWIGNEARLRHNFFEYPHEVYKMNHKVEVCHYGHHGIVEAIPVVDGMSLGVDFYRRTAEQWRNDSEMLEDRKWKQ